MFDDWHHPAKIDIAVDVNESGHNEIAVNDSDAQPMNIKIAQRRLSALRPRIMQKIMPNPKAAKAAGRVKRNAD